MSDGPRYLLIEEVADELRFTTTAPLHPIQACRQWLARQAVPVIHRGARILVDRRVLDAKLARP